MPERGVDRLAQSIGEGDKAPTIKHAISVTRDYGQTVVCTCGETYTGTPADAQELMRGHLATELRP